MMVIVRVCGCCSQRVKLPYDLIFTLHDKREVKIMLAASSDGGAPSERRREEKRRLFKCLGREERIEGGGGL